MTSDDKPKPRWYHLTPDRFLVGLLLVVGALLLSERFVWFPFNEKKGWTVLFAMGTVCGAVVLMLLWFIVALVFRRRFQFSIRSLLVFVLVCAVVCSWFAVRMKQARRQGKALAALGRIDATVYYEHDPITFRNHTYTIGPMPATPNKAPGPSWLRSFPGDDFFDRVVVVGFRQSNTRNASLEHLTDLRGIECVSLSTTWITDDALARLEGLATLKSLDLEETRVTDEGLVHLRSLVNLESLYLAKTQITDAGLVHLKAMANLRVLCLEGTQVTDAGLAHLMEMPHIKEVHLFGTGVTDKGVEDLQKALPHTKIIREQLHAIAIFTIYIASSERQLRDRQQSVDHYGLALRGSA